MPIQQLSTILHRETKRWYNMTKKEMSSLLEAFSERVVEKLVQALNEKKENSDTDFSIV